jgi:Cu-Zn family superoxide dismutase
MCDSLSRQDVGTLPDNIGALVRLLKVKGISMMPRMIVSIAALVMTAGACMGGEATTAKAEFVNMAGDRIGAATLTGTKEGVLIELEVSGLPAGQWVAFHVHETGECDAAGKHESAGGHFNPTGKKHGYEAADGPHAGDMPNLYVGSDGTVRAEVFNAQIRLGEGEADILGRALMIHGGTDDYRSQPAGNAGERYACAVIEKD